MIPAQLPSLMWHAVVILCPLHKMSHVAQLFHSQTLSSVKHCLLMFLPLPTGSTNRVVMTSQTAHTTSDIEMARSGLQLCDDTVFPISSATHEDTQRCMGLQKPQIFLHCDFHTGNKVSLAWLNPHRHTLPHNHIYTDVSSRHQQSGQVPIAGWSTNPEQQN